MGAKGGATVIRKCVAVRDRYRCLGPLRGDVAARRQRSGRRDPPPRALQVSAGLECLLEATCGMARLAGCLARSRLEWMRGCS
jgi:hypothetical protein